MMLRYILSLFLFLVNYIILVYNYFLYFPSLTIRYKIRKTLIIPLFTRIRYAVFIKTKFENGSIKIPPLLVFHQCKNKNGKNKFAVFCILIVKRRVIAVKVFGVHFTLCDSKRLANTVNMKYYDILKPIIMHF